MVSIMTSSKAASAAKVSAANALLDRGYGKPSQHIRGESGPAFVVRIPAPCATAEEWQRLYTPIPDTCLATELPISARSIVSALSTSARMIG
jgi:hypothetical protein